MKWLLIIFMALVGIEMVNALTLKNTCDGDLNIAGETYELSNNIDSNFTCINITANNIILDCKGYSINYSHNATGAATAIGYGAISRANGTIIANCNFIEGKATLNLKHAMLFTNVKNIYIENVSTRMIGAGSLGMNFVYTNMAMNPKDIFINNYTFLGLGTTTGINGSANNLTLINSFLNASVTNSNGMTMRLNLSSINNNRCDGVGNGNCFTLNGFNNSNFYNNNIYTKATSFQPFNSNISYNNYTLAQISFLGGDTNNISNNYINNTGNTAMNLASGVLTNTDIFNNIIYGGNFYTVAFGNTLSSRFYNNYVNQMSGTGQPLNLANAKHNLFRNNTYISNPSASTGIISLQGDNSENNTFIDEIWIANGANTYGIFFNGYGINKTTFINTKVNLTIGQPVIRIRTAYTLTNQNVTFFNLTYLNGSRADDFVSTVGFIGVMSLVNIGFPVRVKTDYWNGTPLKDSNISIYDNLNGIYPMALNVSDNNGYSSYMNNILFYTKNASPAIENKTYYNYNFSAQNLGVTQNLTKNPQFNQDIVFAFSDCTNNDRNCFINCSMNYTIGTSFNITYNLSMYGNGVTNIMARLPFVGSNQYIFQYAGCQRNIYSGGQIG